MTLGQKIKKLRNDKGYTQKDLAEQLHVTFQTVSKWENDENEPDVSTLKELSKVFTCSLDSLLSDEESTNEAILEETNSESSISNNEEPEKTIVIHQKELHVCEICQKDIPEEDLAISQICVSRGGRGRHAEYRQAYYHKDCLHKKQADEARIKHQRRVALSIRARKLSFIWSIVAGVVALVGSLLFLFLNEQMVNQFTPIASVGISIGASYGLFAMIFCILCGSYIGDVFLWCISRSIKFPGLIFTWDIDGFIWVICMKILFAIIAFFFGLFMAIFGIMLSALLGGVSFPFVLIHSEKTMYQDSVFD